MQNTVKSQGTASLMVEFSKNNLGKVRLAQLLFASQATIEQLANACNEMGKWEAGVTEKTRIIPKGAAVLGRLGVPISRSSPQGGPLDPGHNRIEEESKF
jgi:hypothetical protein